ncbi:uncharacterized protein Alr [Procambarus clarkii]|uniref:uncharacterized protein Alr n=1 Tax=Procambarus clarkii TaxID=6728 RepID=UPI00374276A5
MASSRPGASESASAGVFQATCRACTDFKSWMASQRPAAADKLGKIKSESTASTYGRVSEKEETCERESSNAAHNSEEGSSSQASAERTAEGSKVSTDEEEFQPLLWGNAAKYGCPADSISLGRGSWRLLHSMAAYYPTQPTSQEQDDMKTFISLFSKFYPCQPCAEDLREWLKTHSPAVESRSSLSQWFCEAHNEVNRKMEKPLFDCNLINQRWRDGWTDGSCY